MEFLTRLRALPGPADRDLARMGTLRWGEAAGFADFARSLAAEPKGSSLLEAVFGNSPFLTGAWLADPGFAKRLMEQGPDLVFEELVAAMTAGLAGEGDGKRLMKELRIAKRRAALVTGLSDICGIWPLERVTGALSFFAETALGLAVSHLLRGVQSAGDIEKPGGFFVLGMGKLGAQELNYSSDIDLIVMFDPERIAYRGRHSLQELMVRLTRELVRMMEERTDDGYVFRCDLRLRPDPGATPVAVNVLAAEAYYEAMGQNWERAAMIKARYVAGDMDAAQDFLKFTIPYIWRKNLDFAAIADIHSIKRQIDAHKGSRSIKVEGHNLKLGRGGIREIEFFAQTQQLIWGGRIPALRKRGTCEALDALAHAGKISAAAAQELTAAYEFLRRAEHRLQMVDDQQVHSLPKDETGLRHIAVFLGYKDRKSFADELLHHLQTVEKHYAALFEDERPLSGPGNLVFTGTEHDPETLETLSKLGFTDPAAIAATIMAWHHGRYAAMRSARAREILTELVPAILAGFAKTAAPQEAFIRFDAFLARLPAGVQLFSLFESNPVLLDLVAEIMGDAPHLADLLARRPILLDGVLSPDFYQPLAGAPQLERELAEAVAQAQSFEGALDIARRWAGDKRFRVGVQILRNLITADAAGPMFSDIADACLRVLKPLVEADFAKTQRPMPGEGMAVVALGRLGGREMTVGSDLDLVFVFEAHDAQEYFARLSRRLINAITAPTAEGELYAVDMRLRPSGSSGPIASSLESFQRYHAESAWTWEHLALTRARVVAGPKHLAAAVEDIVRETLMRKRETPKLAREVFDMREKMAQEHKARSLFDVKRLRGGLVDAEFIVEFLELRFAHDHPEILSRNTLEALLRISKAGFLESTAAKQLDGALHLWQRILGILRLCYPEPIAAEAAPVGLQRILVRASGASDYPALLREIEERADAVRKLFHELIERAAGPKEDTEERNE
jgi:glutamate-ammonia-ligase adenylyltransferase